jgi:hypothetical protein
MNELMNQEVKETMDTSMNYTLICFFMTVAFLILFMINLSRENETTSVFNVAYVQDNALPENESSDQDFYFEIIEEVPVESQQDRRVA